MDKIIVELIMDWFNDNTVMTQEDFDELLVYASELIKEK